MVLKVVLENSCWIKGRIKEGKLCITVNDNGSKLVFRNAGVLDGSLERTIL